MCCTDAKVIQPTAEEASTRPVCDRGHSEFAGVANGVDGTVLPGPISCGAVDASGGFSEVGVLLPVDGGDGGWEDGSSDGLHTWTGTSPVASVADVDTAESAMFVNRPRSLSTRNRTVIGRKTVFAFRGLAGEGVAYDWSNGCGTQSRLAQAPPWPWLQFPIGSWYALQLKLYPHF